MRARFLTVIKAIAVIVFASFASAAALIAAPPGSQYTPGETLAPTCAPGDPNCSVVPPAASGNNSDITTMNALTRVGIGTASPEVGTKLQVNDTINGGYGADSYDPALGVYLRNGTAFQPSILGRNMVDLGTAVTPSIAVYGEANLAGTVAFSEIRGGDFEAVHSGSGLLAKAYGIVTYVESNLGPITDAAGIRVYANNANSGGTITNNYGIFIDDFSGIGTNNYAIYVNSTTPTVITAAGKIGVGISTPAESLDAQGVDADINLTTFNNTNSDNSTLHLKFARGTQSVPAVVVDGDTIGELKGMLYNGSSYSEATNINFSADCVIGGDKCGAISLRTRAAGGSQPVTRMKIKSNGAIGIGTSSPNDGLVEVKGGTVCVDTNSDDSATSCITTESDIRLKKNIQPIEGALDKIMQINGVTFDWRWDEFEQISRYEAKPHDIGVIAQEVETVFPEALGEDINGYKTVDYRLLVAPLIESVKELKLENDQLKALVCLDHPDAVICQ